MPTYQYACTACGHRFEAVQSFTEASLTECPQCAGKLRKLFGSVGVVFKGSGFYRNDSRADGKPTSAASRPPKEPPAASRSPRELVVQASSSTTRRPLLRRARHRGRRHRRRPRPRHLDGRRVRFLSELSTGASVVHRIGSRITVPRTSCLTSVAHGARHVRRAAPQSSEASCDPRARRPVSPRCCGPAERTASRRLAARQARRRLVAAALSCSPWRSRCARPVHGSPTESVVVAATTSTPGTTLSSSDVRDAATACRAWSRRP